MVWVDGERLGADHAVTFRWGDGEEASANAGTTHSDKALKNRSRGV